MNSNFFKILGRCQAWQPFRGPRGPCSCSYLYSRTSQPKNVDTLSFFCFHPSSVTAPHSHFFVFVAYSAILSSLFFFLRMLHSCCKRSPIPIPYHKAHPYPVLLLLFFYRSPCWYPFCIWFHHHTLSLFA